MPSLPVGTDGHRCTAWTCIVYCPETTQSLKFLGLQPREPRLRASVQSDPSLSARPCPLHWNNTAFVRQRAILKTRSWWRYLIRVYQRPDSTYKIWRCRKFFPCSECHRRSHDLPAASDVETRWVRGVEPVEMSEVLDHMLQYQGSHERKFSCKEWM